MKVGGKLLSCENTNHGINPRITKIHTAMLPFESKICQHLTNVGTGIGVRILVGVGLAQGIDVEVKSDSVHRERLSGRFVRLRAGLAVLSAMPDAEDAHFVRLVIHFINDEVGPHSHQFTGARG